MILLLAFAALAIGVSFLCSMLEASLLSLPRSYVESLDRKGSSTGRLLARMKDNVDRPLAAILTLNTVAHTVGAAGVGAQAAVVFGSAAVGIASAVMTLLILVLSEIIPKTLGAVHAKQLAGITALTTQGMIYLCLPLIVVLESINRLFAYERGGEQFTRAEIAATVHLGRKSGALKYREYRIVSNLLALERIPVKRVLTPRTVVFSLPEEMTVGAAIEAHRPIRFARIPLYRDDPERIVSYVSRFDIDTAHTAGESDRPLREISKKLPVMPEQASVAEVLQMMMRDQQHIALIVDEYGGTEGIITLEDALESLLGVEIVDETDPVVDMRHLAKQQGAQTDR